MDSTELKHPVVVLITLCLGMLVVSLDTTIVNVALPSLATGLHAKLDGVLWVVNAYVLVEAALVVTGGRLGDMLGARRMYVVGLLGFAVTSMLSGIAPNAGLLVLFRFLQGVSAALLMPQVMTLISDIFPVERRGRAMGVMTGTIGISAMAGPVVGGLILAHWSWRWIFYINVPVCLVALALTLLFVPNARPARVHRFDTVGVVLVTGGLGAVTYGLIDGQRYNWGTVTGVLSIPLVEAVGVLALVAFVLWERRYAEPLVPLGLFRYRGFTISTVLNSMGYLGMYGITLLVTLHLQSVSGQSALRTGLTYVPMALTMGVLSGAAGRLTDRFGPRLLMFGGLITLGAGIAVIAAVESEGSGPIDFLFPLMLAGAGVAFVMAPANTEAVHDLPERLNAAASGTFNSSRQVMGAISIAVVGAALHTGLANAIPDKAARAAEQLPPGQRASFVSGVTKAVDKGGFASSQPTIGGSGGSGGVLARATHEAYGQAFAVAERPTMALLVVLVVVLAPICFMLARREPRPQLAGEPRKQAQEGVA